MIPATGYALRSENRPHAGDASWTAVEIDAQQASHPLRTEPYLQGLSFDYVSLHSLELSIASPTRPERAYLDELRAVALENGAAAITDHLGFTRCRAGGPAVGHVMAPPFTPSALAATCRNIEWIQRQIAPLDFYVENLAHFFVLEGSLDEAEFMVRMLRETGCGLLLDVTNAFANQVNFQTDAAELIEAVVPAAAQIQMHLAGGFFDPRSGRYIDSHSQPIPEAVWDLYRLALRRGGQRIRAVFIERDWNFADEPATRRELREVRQAACQEECRPCAC